MKKYLALLCLLVFYGQAFGQATTPLPPGQLSLDRSIAGLISGTSCPSDLVTTTTFTQPGCVTLNTQGATALTVLIGGGWTGTLFFEGTNEDKTVGSQWQFINLYSSSGTQIQYTTSTGFIVGSIGGYRKFRVRAIGSWSNAATIAINAANGKLPDVSSNITGNLFFKQYTSDNPGEIIYVTGSCTNFPYLTLSIIATGDNSGQGGMLATISQGNIGGVYTTYKKVPIGSSVAAIINGRINSHDIKINIPYDATAAGTVTIMGDCTK